jgi:hypothetical protein
MGNLTVLNFIISFTNLTLNGRGFLSGLTAMNGPIVQYHPKQIYRRCMIELHSDLFLLVRLKFWSVSTAGELVQS